MTNRRILAVCILLGLFAGGCTSTSDLASLDSYLCSRSALGGDFKELTRGNFTPRDLSGLRRAHGPATTTVGDTGFVRGAFVYYKSVLPKPPFDPPANVVCAVMEFQSTEDADAWVGALSPRTAASSIVLGMLPGEGFEAHAETVPNGVEASAFRVTSDGPAGRTNVLLVVGARERYVTSVAWGGEDAAVVPLAAPLSLWQAGR